MSTSSTRSSPLAFDLDGTLISTKSRQVAVLESLLPSEGVEGLDLDRVWELKREGLTTRSALEALGVDPTVSQRLGRRWVASIESPRWLLLDRLIPGVTETLDALAAAGHRPVILTARRHRRQVRGQVAAFGLTKWCAEVRVVSPISAAEEKAIHLRALGCRNFVGDTESDGNAAGLAGVGFAAVSTGQRSRRFLGARHFEVFESLKEALVGLGEL